MSAIAYLDRVNISIAGKAISNEFKLSHVQLGWVFSAFLIGYALFQAPAGRLADRAGPRLVLLVGVVWWAVFTVLITVLPTGKSSMVVALMLTRFCLGVGEAVMYPASNTVVSAWVPSVERGFANGLIFAGVGFGAGVTSPLIAYIMVHSGWRTAFYFSAALGLLAGIVWFVIARNRPREHPWVSPAELTYIENNLTTNKAQPVPQQIPWADLLTSRNLWAITFSYFAFGYAAQIFFSWFFIYLSEIRGLDLRQSSFYTMLPFIAMALGSIGGGIISDMLTKAYGKRVGRCGIAMFGIALCSLFIVIGAQVASAQFASIVLAGGAGALYLSSSSFWSVSADIGGKSAGTVSGFMNMGGQLGGALTASLTPYIADHLGWNIAFTVAAGLCLLGAFAWLFIGKAATE